MSLRSNLFKRWDWNSRTQQTESNQEALSESGGHPIPVFPGYGTNSARNNGADLEPIPITPVRAQNWPGMQVQLCNGWDKTNYGKKMEYDDYLRMLTDSSTKARSYLLPTSGLGPSAVNPGPAPGNVQSMIQTTSGSQPNTPGGPGFIASGVNLSGRGYYG
jgi:hypothetical protein